MSDPPAPVATAREGLSQQDAEEVWDSVSSVYAGFLGGDPDRVDACLDPSVTIWNHDHGPLLMGVADLDAVRALRLTQPSTEPSVRALTPSDVLVDGTGGVAWCRHLLTVERDDGTTTNARVTDVLRRTEGRWLICHHHEQELPAGGL